MARVRPRGFDAVLRAAAPRDRHDQVEPQQDHRRWHRLALPEPAEARAEGVSAPGTPAFPRLLPSSALRNGRYGMEWQQRPGAFAPLNSDLWQVLGPAHEPSGAMQLLSLAH